MSDQAFSAYISIAQTMAIRVQTITFCTIQTLIPTLAFIHIIKKKSAFCAWIWNLACMFLNNGSLIKEPWLLLKLFGLEKI